MIKFEYKPWEPERTWGYAEDIPPVEQLTMTLGDGVTWQEATDEFHNFLRGAGYVIPYYNVNEADEDAYEYAEEVEAKRTREQMLMDIREWARDDSNTGVASEDESNTDVAEVERLRAKKKQIGKTLTCQNCFHAVDTPEWVGLTDDEVEEAVQFPWHFRPFARAIEAKLKEKNT